ncbi:hypothetical protein H257_11107 [Aphanomyces astaci]|uniref:DDE Tnp4 domain-containing protein n=1 Tax=Aphanomyces astaci TaxID=112090 RepID=W4G369_APHAT|nr:hypothetical protein H257_11107 [Aphanomyces astaci]ETV74142.1 hypothetical protein H257_11107 [Aphanomyces astaci]|eukprot:XP_009836248.1 hypothetical protein H257_11107 [Aphanomyces astaci]
MYSAAVKTKGSYMDNIFGFIDGSKFETCRITQKRERVASSFADLQRLIYSGHKRRHCLNFQAVTAPDGLCEHFWGAVQGLSKLEAYLDARRDLFRDFLVYGDPANGVLEWICSGYKGSDLDDRRNEFNSSMGKLPNDGN